MSRSRSSSFGFVNTFSPKIVAKRFDAARSDYDKAIAYDPKEALNYFKRGNASFQRGKFDDAINDYTKALELQPDLKAAADNREVAKRRKAAGG